ncbi:hypothetical protein [Streptomyces sp. NPDC058953]|uniref:hypothetical protein n=1 Tax=unclassified Streptomyces TaxID=2593676 RepID=UPI003699570F
MTAAARATYSDGPAGDGRGGGWEDPGVDGPGSRTEAAPGPDDAYEQHEQHEKHEQREEDERR